MSVHITISREKAWPDNLYLASLDGFHKEGEGVFIDECQLVGLVGGKGVSWLVLEEAFKEKAEQQP